jgi:hypothetical protein
MRFGWTASFLVAASLSVLGGIAWLLVDPEATLDAEMVRVQSGDRIASESFAMSNIEDAKDAGR